LAISHDNGLTWSEKVIIENDPDKETEYSYPAIITYGNRVALTYTWNRRRIAFREFEIKN
jgi:predicted neuraminidase